MKPCWPPLLAGVLLALAFLAGCVGPGPYRKELSSYSGATPSDRSNAHVEEEGPPLAPGAGPGYRLYFIEFDDQGVLWQRKAEAYALDHVREALLAPKARAGLVVTFVHGWQNNAAADNDNVQLFRGTLQLLAQMDSLLAATEHRLPRQVIGVYVGWRGKSLNLPSPLHVPTFWDRKNTAEVVGRRSTEIFDRLEVIVDERRARDRAERGGAESLSATRLVTIGHSFGADLACNALGQRLVGGLSAYQESELLDPKRPPAPVRGYGDLVVFINPAFEALQLASVRDLVAAAGPFPATQRPVLAVLTSESDSATGLWFALGRRYRSVTTRYREREDDPLPLSERSADQTALGHYEPFLTHRLDAAGGTLGPSGEPDSFAAWALGKDELEIARVVPGDPNLGAGHLAVTALAGSGGAPSPFLNIRVASTVFDGHALPPVPSPGRPSEEFYNLLNAVAGLVRLADFPARPDLQRARNEATGRMIRAMAVR